LRRSPGGVKFRRQHPVGRYFLDFYVAKLRLAIEIDGLAHELGDRPQRDQARDAFLRDAGIEVVRIPAAEVLQSPEDVAQMLVSHCLAR
jgi:very-short-patch-repair endonuclease